MTRRAVIFDFDGTMLDTETLWYEAYQQVYRKYGAELPLEEFVKCVGTSLDHFDPMEYLEQQIGRKVDREAVRREIADLNAASLTEEELRPGVREMIRAAQAEGCLLAIATSSHRKWILPFLERFGLSDTFDFLATADLVAKVKPDPALYRVALEGLGIESALAVAIEDSAHGARAAVTAGIRCVVVPNPVTAHLAFPEGVERWETLAGRTVRELFAQER